MNLYINQIITVCRNTGFTSVPTLRGQSGQIEALNNIFRATTSLAVAGLIVKMHNFNGIKLI